MTRPNSYGTTNYAGNIGGAGQNQIYSGTIVPLVSFGDYPRGRAGIVTMESIRDGSSQTALFSERLYGLAGNPPIKLTSPDGKRGTYIVRPTDNTRDGSGAAGANALIAACKGLAGNTNASNTDHFGNNAYVGFPIYVSMVNYNHVGTPNSMTCLNYGADRSWLTYAGPYSSTPATSNHPGGVNVSFADGSVRFVKDTITPEVWWGLGTRNGREVISSDAY